MTSVAQMKSEGPGGSVTDQVRRALEDQIREGRIAPGSSLVVKDVAEQFSISRTPAKEALLQLAASGLVSFHGRRGAVVTKLELSEIFGMAEVLAVLEAEAARLSARRMDTHQRAALLAVHAEAAQALAQGNTAAYTDANLRLHQLIYDGAGNEFLRRSIMEIRQRLAVYRPLSFERSGRMKASHREHDAIVDAIARGDEADAHEAMTTHITVAGTAQAELMLKYSREARAAS